MVLDTDVNAQLSRAQVRFKVGLICAANFGVLFKVRPNRLPRLDDVLYRITLGSENQIGSTYNCNGFDTFILHCQCSTGHTHASRQAVVAIRIRGVAMIDAVDR